jgi:putative endonuclease
VTRRYKARHGEIDLVALDGDVLVFVEVKERRARGYVPEEGVGARKASRLAAAAREYLTAMGEREREFRFDVIAIDADGLRHHRDVFRD